MNRKALLIIVVTAGTIFAAVGITKATGYWKTESSKIPLKIAEGEFAGKSDPGDIRGSYSFSDIENAFGVSPEILAAAFMFNSGSPGGIQAKELEDRYPDLEGNVEVGTDSVRLFTALWSGLPFVPEDTTVLPLAAVELLVSRGKVDQAAAAELMKIAVDPGGTTASGTDSGTTGETPDHEVSDRMVRGLSTFGDLKEWGVSEEAWEESAGLPMGSRGSALKDWAAEEGVAMSEIKSQAQSLVDAAE